MTMSGDYIFVISQIGEKGSPERTRANDVFEYVITEVANEKGLEAKRVDRDPTPGVVTTQIVQGIINATLVVADLTGKNPNVYYELGVGNSFAKPTVLLVNEPSGLPFDVRNERMIILGSDETLGAKAAAHARAELAAAIEAVFDPDYRVSNLVTEAAAARSLDALAPRDPVASELSVIRDKLTELASAVDSTGWTFGYADVQQLKALLEKHAANGTLPTSWLDEIELRQTTPFFDSWLDTLKGVAGRAEQERKRQVQRRIAKGAVTAKSTEPLSVAEHLYDEEPF